MEPLSILNLSMTICLVIGGFIAYHHGFARTANEVQERVINALQSEIQALHDRIAALEKENTRLNYTITTICTSLKQRGIHVTIDGDMVSIHDYTNGSSTYNSRIQGAEEIASPVEEDLPTVHGTEQPAKRRTKKRTSSVAATKTASTWE